MHAQTSHTVCPVSVGDSFSAMAGEFDVTVPGSCPAVEVVLVVLVLVVLVLVVPVVVLDGVVLTTPSPGDCPGRMYGDCGVLAR